MDLKINGDGQMPQFQVIEMRPGYIKTRIKYSNGLILITEQSPEGTNVFSSHNFIKEIDGTLTPDLSSPNKNFVDIKES
ncbi:hypothetical protein ACQV2X_05415 [Facklamia sp. P12945]|uniref:hypothetical protein n=1 Tax=unclassified Facklamia TaxID=2622293 RepID=UPI003D182E3F